MPAQLASFETIDRQNMPDDLMIRAVTAGYGATAPELLLQSPEISGDFSFEFGDTEDNLLKIDSPGGTVIAEDGLLPSISSQESHFAEMQEDDLLRELMNGAVLSTKTGCIMRPDLKPNHNGYSSDKSSVTKEVGLRSYMQIHRMAYFLANISMTGNLPTKFDLRKHVDHICRNPGCCNPEHHRLLSGRVNNLKKDEARQLEPIIINGQLFYMGDLKVSLPWIEYALIDDYEQASQKVISTRVGPFALRTISRNDGIVVGEKVSCEAFDMLRPRGKNNYIAPSRKRKHKPLEGETGMYRRDKYTKQHIPTQKELYDAAMAAA